MACAGQQPNIIGFKTQKMTITRVRRPYSHFAQQPIIKQNLYLPQTNFNQVLFQKMVRLKLPLIYSSM
jgi:hypothetical protein